MLVAWELPSDQGVRETWEHALPHAVRARTRFVESDGMLDHYTSVLDRSEYADCLNALVVANIACLRRWPWPSVYDKAFGLRYAEKRCADVAGTHYEVWRTLPALAIRGVGDCASLAPARCAELVAGGEIDARVKLELQLCRDDGSCIWHVLVMRNGGAEDPSAVLGMGWAEAIDESGPFGLACPATLER